MPVGYRDASIDSSVSLSEASTREETTDASLAMDWHKVADDRLSRLVDLEHDHSVMRDRLLQLQIEHRGLARQHVSELQAELERMQRQLHEQAEQYRREYEAMEAAFLHSSCWRITRPLRAMSHMCIGLAQRGRPPLRVLLRVRGVRRLGRLALRRFPKLHQRLYLALYRDVDGS